ncbi:MAG: cobalt-precorrin-6A reductase [Alphaproteobacteria bacterium]|nr:cobalt-precorrin-6A reductase [Alphaproteobacteria bacterium]
MTADAGCTPLLLLLGGTGEALALAASLAATFGPRLRVITSLAGRTRDPRLPEGALRVGGFGGAEAMAEWLRGRAVDAVVDATHPFAIRISANAAAACDVAGVPRLVLERPAWTPRPDDCWHEVDDAAAAASRLPALGRRAFLTLGPRDLAPFAPLAGMWFLVRQVDPPTAPVPLDNCTVVTGRGPFDLDGERRLLLDHAINVVVTRASGGTATIAKLEAARALSLPVAMIRRPPPPPGPRVADLAEAVYWVGEQCGLDIVA